MYFKKLAKCVQPIVLTNGVINFFRFNAGYITFYFLGTTMLLPWFFFITAEEVSFNSMGHDSLKQHVRYLSHRLLQHIQSLSFKAYILDLFINRFPMRKQRGIYTTEDFQPGLAANFGDILFLNICLNIKRCKLHSNTIDYETNIFFLALGYIYKS